VGVPITADVVYIERTSSDILYGLAQTAVTLAGLHVRFSFTGRIGLPHINATGAYIEYRDQSLEIKATVATIDGTSAKQINLGTSTAATSINVTGTGIADDNSPPLSITGTNAGNTIHVARGTVGVGHFANGEDTSFPVVTIGYLTTVANDASVSLGSGATTAVVTQNGGTLFCDSATTTLNVHQGVCYLGCPETIAAVNEYGGTVYYNTASTTTTLMVAGGTLDFRLGNYGPTITNTSVRAGASIFDPLATATFTNGIDLTQCSLSDVTLDLGVDVNWITAAI
jgi:hypothetical protein